jgi:hypothetical protein
MTYLAGSTIVATDYNGFVATNGSNVNAKLAVGSGTNGYGEPALSTVAAAAVISATQWATLNSKISAMASHQGTAITSRANPVAAQTIAILANLNTDITNIQASNNAVASGAQYTAWTGTNSKTTGTGVGDAAWTITFTSTVTWATPDATRYFFNAGGRIKNDTSKTSTGQLGDAEWNDLATTLCGDIYITGVSAAKTIAGSSYTGVTKVGGTGTPNTLATSFGWYSLTTSDTLIYRQYADTAPYTDQYISVFARQGGSGTQLILTTVWTDPGGNPAPGGDNLISGGTAAVGATPGTAPCSICTYFPPSSTYLTSASWGIPTIATTVA